ncbi:hypothetical protein RD110_12220 [Rhodoferax koreense]|uniref:DUF1345 domain-containing protein n=1 Tax=Rhodoferax koreensis TaxID=1842727 RepID=A0A1P8JVV5_9BURK|nr:DUF1345 domain-containing protein [Rhodoferax koreense]APW37868.1 hypothetical protein RD110_12220 [Rhodoferax koreense]
MRKHFSETTGPQRVVYGVVVGLGSAAVPLPLSGELRGLMAWCLAVSVYLILAWWLAETFDAERTRERARQQDQSSPLLFFVLVLAGLASVAAIVMLLQNSKDLKESQRAWHISLSMAAVALSWLLIQTTFAFRYAHRYYQEELNNKVAGAGLDFPGKLDPDYFDFLYYSFVVGMTSQVSDVQVTSREMRRITLVHSVLSFGFNMLVLALSINVVAGSIQ